MKSPKPDKSLHEINLTPLVDVSLTLVIIFMVASPFILQSQIQISTPALQNAANAKAASDLKAEVYLTEQGELKLNGKSLAWESFGDSLKAVLQASRSKQVIISADDGVLHDQVVAVLDRAKQSGAAKLSVIRRN